MKTTQQLNHSITPGFIGKPLRASQETVLASCNDCIGILQDTDLLLFSGSSVETMQQAQYFNPESGVYEDVNMTIKTGETGGQLRFTDISIGEYFQFKSLAGVAGTLGNLKINY